MSVLRPLVLCAVLAAPLPLLACTPAPPKAGAAPAPERRALDPINVRAVAPPAAPIAGLLDGVPMSEAERRAHANVLPVAVMVDNYPDARPQYGLGQAEIVYEALVEGGITRFMAVYWRNDAARIQPVRSARTQFLPLALELDAVYAHVGSAAEDGAANADAQMREWGVRSVDEDGSGGAITRDPERQAPKNAVTSTDGLIALSRSLRWATSPRTRPWSFKDDGGAAGPPVQALDLDFDLAGINGGAFAVRWQYDPSTNRYLRGQGGAPQRDAATGEQLAARNVIVQVCDVHPAGDRSGHVLYTTEGSGQALVLLDGRMVQATWRKDGRDQRTRYYDAAGHEIALNRGNTWVELVPAGAPIRAA